MNSTTADMMAVGSHCMFPGCNQRDFLPFKCDCCRLTFCGEHRTYSAHDCTQAASADSRVIVCPLCQQSIHLSGGEDVNEVFERHCRSGTCEPANAPRRRPRCPVPGCKTKLTEATTYHCKDCGTKVCFSHRFESDHGCKDIRAARTLSLPRFHQSVGRHASTMSQAAASAMARMTQSNTPSERRSGGSVPRTETRNGLERCPHCGQAFDNAVDLVRHVQAHQYQEHLAEKKTSNSECVIF